MRHLFPVLVIGAGSIGERHVRCFLNTGRARVSVAEPNAQIRNALETRYPALHRLYASLDEALAGEKYQAAVIATPAPLHVPMASRLALAGLHVLIEKPLSTKLDGIEELQDLLSDRRLVGAVAYVYRAHPSLAAMRDAIRTGRFGRPIQIVAQCGQNFPTYRPAYCNTYYADRKAGGGAVQDALTHVINAGEWLVGPVTRLVADADRLVLEGVDVEDTVHVITRHGDVMGCFSLNQHQAPNETSITVICERGTTRWQYHDPSWGWMAIPDGGWRHEPATSLERDTLFTRQADSFLDAVEKQEPPLCSIAEGLQTLNANLAILASVEGSRWCEVHGGTSEERSERCAPVGHTVV